MIEKTVGKIHVRPPDGEYPIFIGSGLLDLTPIAPLLQATSSRCAIITNPRVGSLYAERLAKSLRAHDFQPHVIEMPEGEAYKTLDTLRTIYDQMVDSQLDRRSIVFALGGGVVGDVAGFAAATFLRGVPFVQLPTTLLAMVDSSLGGKTAIDHPRGKNLIGAFKQPLAVIADTDTLATLPDKEFRSGMAEVVKHGIIGDEKLFQSLEDGHSKSDVESWIERAIRVKVEIIERDPFEKSERAKLNLGHTFGHALEQVSEYKMLHGEGVAIGLICATRLAAARGLCEASLFDRIESLVRAINLPTRVPREFSPSAILEAMQTDKKRLNARLRFVLPRSVGNVTVVENVEKEEILAVLEQMVDGK